MKPAIFRCASLLTVFGLATSTTITCDETGCEPDIDLSTLTSPAEIHCTSSHSCASKQIHCEQGCSLYCEEYESCVNASITGTSTKGKLHVGCNSESACKGLRMESHGKGELKCNLNGAAEGSEPCANLEIHAVGGEASLDWSCAQSHNCVDNVLFCSLGSNPSSSGHCSVEGNKKKSDSMINTLVHCYPHAVCILNHAQDSTMYCYPDYRFCICEDGDDQCKDVTFSPTVRPTISPSDAPTSSPTTSDPTTKPTDHPSQAPTSNPTPDPTSDPTSNPNSSPTETPTSNPTFYPTRKPSKQPTVSPTLVPTSTTTKIQTTTNDGIGSVDTQTKKDDSNSDGNVRLHDGQMLALIVCVVFAICFLLIFVLYAWRSKLGERLDEIGQLSLADLILKEMTMFERLVLMIEMVDITTDWIFGFSLIISYNQTSEFMMVGIFVLLFGALGSFLVWLKIQVTRKVYASLAVLRDFINSPDHTENDKRVTRSEYRRRKVDSAMQGYLVICFEDLPQILLVIYVIKWQTRDVTLVEIVTLTVSFLSVLFTVWHLFASVCSCIDDDFQVHRTSKDYDTEHESTADDNVGLDVMEGMESTTGGVSTAKGNKHARLNSASSEGFSGRKLSPAPAIASSVDEKQRLNSGGENVSAAFVEGVSDSDTDDSGEL